jgi:ABC-type microcin C transport system permease subunit YejB
MKAKINYKDISFFFLFSFVAIYAVLQFAAGSLFHFYPLRGEFSTTVLPEEIKMSWYGVAFPAIAISLAIIALVKNKLKGRIWQSKGFTILVLTGTVVLMLAILVHEAKAWKIL